ncbi:threonine--tRNA ligase [Candidatus Saccharibacteria bacterium]|nr:threonine--tRNA ligase [Candidatus Saccharibacteria bacterium]MBI3337777.1 threonine--tRNA ligase [Candidatus Saccharibacteria bacterium]
MIEHHNDGLSVMRHSLAHIMATTIQHIWPNAKFGVGPVVENGFYYDVDLGETKISDNDFQRIETEMKKIIDLDQPFNRTEKLIEEAIEWAKNTEQPYKAELLNDLKRAGTTVAKDLDIAELGTIVEGDAKVETVSFYTNGDFTDLCRGPHVVSTGKVGVFKLMRVSGAYWRGNENNAQMQRIYGVAFATKEELVHHLEMLEEAKKRDHRKLGQELDLFVFSDMVGSGLPMFTPQGTILRDQLACFSNELREAYGYQKVWVPHMTKRDLYEASGHWAKFGDELFMVKSQETSDELVLKPMNCPHHTRIYANKQRSYRDLPVRYLETTTVYRDEKTGELGGLSRVRSITQDDSHAFCREDQIEDEINNLLSAAQVLYSTIDMKLKVRLSYRGDGDTYLGDEKLWKSAQEQLKRAILSNKLDYFEAEGEAAFYGPKIDFMATDAIGREHQVATVQLDFVMPERFKLEYVAEDGSLKTPIMIHSALLGSIERFLSVYIEHTAGRFPIWLAPEQLRLITVNQEEKTIQFANSVLEKAKEYDIRATIDNGNESVGKKIRSAEVWKVPYSIVIGEKEIESGMVTPRIRSDMTVANEHSEHEIENFFRTIANEAKSRINKSSL